MAWLYSEGNDFRICPICGSVYPIQSGDGEYNYCPCCGEKLREEVYHENERAAS